MAGEWLKMECATPDKPEVFAITTKMGWDDPDFTVGKLFRVWRWFDQQTVDGNAVSVTLALLDRILCVSGFAQAMVDVGWLRVTDVGLSLPNFDNHNGASAKKRAQTAKRVANHKSNASSNANGNAVGNVVSNAVGNALSVSEALPKEDKKREEKIKVKSTVEQTALDQTIEQIFAYWQKVMDSPKSKLDTNRKNLIMSALENYSASDVCHAIRGCSKTPHNMGQNSRNTKFNGLDLILRNAEKIDYFIGLDGVQARSSAPDSLESANARAMAEFLGASPPAADDSRTIDMESLR